jgi:hypothetical protein
VSGETKIKSIDVVTEPGEYDGFPFRSALSIGPYSVLILHSD